MPTYDYRCAACKCDFDIIKSMSSIDVVESCPSCQSACDKSCRVITKGKEFYGEKPDEPFFSIPLGKWVKGNCDMRRQAKQRGLIEVGNEDVNKLVDRAERDREKKRNDGWREFTNPSAYQIRGA